MVNNKMYELGTKKSTIRTIFEFGRKRAAEVGEENVYDLGWDSWVEDFFRTAIA